MTLRRLLVWVALSATVIGCTTTPDPNQMNRLASALTKLSAAVDANVRYDDIPPHTTSDAILSKSTADDPDLLTPFKGYRLQVFRDGMSTLVLVCDSNEKTALLEDAGCTAKMDSHRWSATTNTSCQPSLDLKAVCPKP